MKSDRPLCQALLKDGRPCKKSAQKGAQLCGTHLRAKRAAWLKKIEGGAKLVKLSSTVVSAAVKVYGLYALAAPHIPQIMEVISHYNPFIKLEEFEVKGTADVKSQLESFNLCIDRMQMADSIQGFVNAYSAFMIDLIKETESLSIAVVSLDNQPTKMSPTRRQPESQEHRLSRLSHLRELSTGTIDLLDAIAAFEMAAHEVNKSLTSLGQQIPG